MAEDDVSQRTGVPYPSPDAGPVTSWSLEAYEYFKEWARARGGVWERWEPDYLVLTLITADGAPVEPFVIHTIDDELTITFGYWHNHLDGDDEAAVREAKEYAEKWLSGEWSTAVYQKADGSWCGSRLIDQKDLPDWLADTTSLAYFQPTHVEYAGRESRNGFASPLLTVFLLKPEEPDNAYG